jgi:hypothetical protein
MRRKLSLDEDKQTHMTGSIDQVFMFGLSFLDVISFYLGTVLDSLTLEFGILIY